MPIITRSKKIKENERPSEIDEVETEQDECLITMDDSSNRTINPTTNSFIDWEKYRDYETEKLRLIKRLNDTEMSNIDLWLENATRVYDEIHYSDSNRIYQTLSYLNDQEKKWYEQERNDIGNDWNKFCDKLRQYALIRSKTFVHSRTEKDVKSKGNAVEKSQEDIDQFFQKFSDSDDAELWLMHVLKQFKQVNVTRNEQMKILPLLLENDAYLWYVKNLHLMENIEVFSNLFLQRFSSNNMQTQEKTSSLASNLLNTMAREIIKSPSFFTGSKDDVDEWLEKLEARFTMAGWDDEQKLRYISIHLQGDAYKWWMKAASKIKTWSVFTSNIRQAFGSTKAKELAFEQLRAYKQTINQSTIQYYEKIIELCKRVDPDMSDTMKLQYLLAGVKEFMKIHIVLHDPQSTEAFLTFARKIEDAFSLTRMDHASHRIQSQEELSIYPTTVSTMHYTKRNDDKFSSNYRDKQKEKQLFHSHSMVKGETKTNRHMNQSSNRQKSKTCYNCGTLGHYYRDCTRSHFEQRKHR